MEGLLTNNIFFIYLLGVLVIINYEAFQKEQKIAIIYACSFGLTFNGELRCILIVTLLLFILFLYEEYLNEDSVKIKYVKKIKYKILDFLYMYIIQYKLLYVLLAIGFKSNVCVKFFEDILKNYAELSIIMKNILLVISILLLIIGVHKMFNNPVELNNFRQMVQKFNEYPYYQLPLKDKNKRRELFRKLELVADIEDYTFFVRKKSYSSLSFEFIKAVINEKKKQSFESEGNSENIIVHFWIRVKNFFRVRNFILFINRKHKMRIIGKHVRKIINEIGTNLEYIYGFIKRKIRRYFRGYSTIEMQLLRILAYRKGLTFGRPKESGDTYLIITRKIYEVIYSPIFFSGHKDYLNISKEKDFYRYYLVYIYLHTVQTKLNNNTFAPLDRIFGDIDVIDWPEEALFIIALGLNNMKITNNRVDTYAKIINKYQLNREKIEQLVDCIS